MQRSKLLGNKSDRASRGYERDTISKSLRFRWLIYGAGISISKEGGGGYRWIKDARRMDRVKTVKRWSCAAMPETDSNTIFSRSVIPSNGTVSRILRCNPDQRWTSFISRHHRESLRKSQNRRGRGLNVTHDESRMARRNRYRIVENFPKPDIV